MMANATACAVLIQGNAYPLIEKIRKYYTSEDEVYAECTLIMEVRG